jgi:hypothetical protein
MVPTVPDHDWDDLVAAALLGTARRPSAPQPRTLLDAAATATVRRRAGLSAATGVPPLDPAPPDPRPLPPAPARARLAWLLADDDGMANRPQLLADWLHLARSAGYRAPAELLPELLAAARGRSELREDAAALAGPLGRWLAVLNPSWSALLRTSAAAAAAEADDPSADPHRIWREGLFTERVSHLTALRRRDPGAALALLRSEWARERAEDRLLFLDALQEKLSPADERFLEGALSDRSPNVRRTAAELLSALPGSALAARMAERARAAVRVLPGPGGRILVEPPAACDAGMQRDGIPVKSPTGPTGRGDRACWLGETIAATPLTTWAETREAPEALLRLPVADGWQDEIHAAWARAALRQGDADWARALLGVLPPGAAPPPGLLTVLPQAERADWAAEFVSRHGLADAFPSLTSCPAPWPERLGSAVLGALARAAEGGAYPWTHHGVLGAAERALAPASADEVAARASEPGLAPAWAEVLERLSATLRVRSALAAELA